MSQYVEANLKKMMGMMDKRSASDVFEQMSAETNFSVSSIKKAYQRKCKKKNDVHAKVHSNRALSKFDESILMGYLLMRSEASFGEKVDGIVEFTHFLEGGPISLRTAQRIVKRNENLLRPTQQRQMAKGRCDSITVEHTHSFIEVWQATLNYCHNPPKDHIVNADESVLRATKDGTHFSRLEAVYKKGGSDFLASTKSIGTITPFVGAEGTVWLVVFCLKIPKTRSESAESSFSMYVPIDPPARRSDNTPLEMMICGTSSGFLNSYWWDQAVQKFVETVRRCSLTPQREIILVTDNLGIHRQPKSIANALANGCYQIYFPPNCSHWIQPLDDLLFAGLKAKMRKFCSQTFDATLYWERRKLDLRMLILEAVMDAFPIIFSKENIRSAWGNVGVVPFRTDIMIMRAQQNVGILEAESEKEDTDISNVDDEIVAKAKDIFTQLNSQHEESMEHIKKTKRVTISSQYAKSGSTGMLVLQAAVEYDIQELERKEAAEKRAEAKLLENQRKKVAKKQEKEEAKRLQNAETARQDELKRMEREERKKQRDAITCRINDCKRVWKDKTSFDAKWLWCSHCDTFGVCWGHIGTKEGEKILGQHERTCQHV